MTALLLIAAFALGCMLALVLAVAALLAMCALATAVCAWVWVTVVSARYERVLRARYEALPPSQKLTHRHTRPALEPLRLDTDEYWEAAREASAAAEGQQHAEAMAAVAADIERAERPPPSPTVGYTAVMPIVVTGVAAALGTAVVEPPQLPWKAPVVASTGRHAGMPAELAEFDWEPAGGVR